MTRQKTMYSLCKLAKLAAPLVETTQDYVGYVDSQLDLINLQEELPDYVLHQYGFDVARPRVLEPQEIARLYVCDEHKEAGEIEFRKALDVLAHVADGEARNELFVEIWADAVLRDSWSRVDLESPMEALQDTLFFRLADLSLALGKRHISNVLDY